MTKGICPKCGNRLILSETADYHCNICDEDFNWDDVIHEEYTPKKEYKGRVPSGCAACGGPYPDCRKSCDLYDE